MALTPPDVGAEDANSAIDMPTRRINTLATSHYNSRQRTCLYMVKKGETYTPNHGWTSSIRQSIEKH